MRARITHIYNLSYRTVAGDNDALITGIATVEIAAGESFDFHFQTVLKASTIKVGDMILEEETQT